MNKKQIITQEFRQDIFTKEWILVSTTNNRPHTIVGNEMQTSNLSDLIDPFTDIINGISREIISLELKDEQQESQVFIVKNQYPLLKNINLPAYQTEGPYNFVAGEGIHEVVVYRDYEIQIRDFSIKKIALMFKAFQARSLSLMSNKHIRYIAIIHNHGYKAGASILHPHSQIVATPIVPDGIERILEGAQQYHRSNNRDLAQVIIEYEQNIKQRIIIENNYFIALAPYASRVAYEVEIYPKYPQIHFAYSNQTELYNLAKIYKFILKSYYEKIGDIDYNMSIITAPVDGNLYKGFRWFIRLTPRINFVGGYEIGTDTDICLVSPEIAADILS
jgi:UDPglucose--hexose-1-phosphate uridylyltransferase